ncbi:MAG: hypothetical protein R3F43_06810 [bacterium]
MYLPAGRWHLLLLPGTTEAVRLTTIDRDEDPVKLEGPGPHPLPFGGLAEHVWHEPADGQPRTPHVWTFTLPADVDVSIGTSEAIVAVLLGQDGQRIAAIGANDTWEGALPRGAYRVEVQGAYADDGSPYSLSLTTTQLVAGASKMAARYDDTRIPFAIGEAGLYTLVTSGEDDVRLTVLDADGQVLARADDQPEDWNPRLTLPLAPGRYTAIIDGIEDDGIELRLRHDLPVEAPPLAVGKATSVVPVGGGIALPLTGVSAIVRAEIQAEEGISLALEARDGDTWRVLAEAQGRRPTVAARPDPAVPLRLRVTSLDERDRLALVRTTGLTPAPLEAARLQAGAAPAPSGQVAVFLGFPRASSPSPTSRPAPSSAPPSAQAASRPGWPPRRRRHAAGLPGRAWRPARPAPRPRRARRRRCPPGRPSWWTACRGRPRWVELEDPIGQPGVALIGGRRAYAPRRPPPPSCWRRGRRRCPGPRLVRRWHRADVAGSDAPARRQPEEKIQGRWAGELARAPPACCGCRRPRAVRATLAPARPCSPWSLRASPGPRTPPSSRTSTPPAWWSCSTPPTAPSPSRWPSSRPVSPPRRVRARRWSVARPGPAPPGRRWPPTPARGCGSSARRAAS